MNELYKNDYNLFWKKKYIYFIFEYLSLTLLFFVTFFLWIDWTLGAIRIILYLIIRSRYLNAIGKFSCG